MRKLFGTDGIRGIANKYPLTIDICVKLAKAITKNFRKNNDKRLEIIIGKDTRISGDMFEHILAATFSSLGIDTHLIITPKVVLEQVSKMLSVISGAVRVATTSDSVLERETGIGPASSAWKADALPLSYARGRIVYSLPKPAPRVKCETRFRGGPPPSRRRR